MNQTQMSYVKTQNHNANLKSNVKYRAYKFSLTIIDLVKDFPQKRAYWIIGDQLLRSSTSIGANLVEAKSSSSRRDFIKFYEIALKSANETIYWLMLLKDSKLVEAGKSEPLITEVKEIGKMIAASLLTLKGKRS